MYILYTIKAKSLKLNVITGMGWMLYLKFERLHTRWTIKKRRWWDGNLLDIFFILFFVLLSTFTRLLFACIHGGLSCLLPVACLLVTFITPSLALALFRDLSGLFAIWVLSRRILERVRPDHLVMRVTLTPCALHIPACFLAFLFDFLGLLARFVAFL